MLLINPIELKLLKKRGCFSFSFFWNKKHHYVCGWVFAPFGKPIKRQKTYEEMNPSLHRSWKRNPSRRVRRGAAVFWCSQVLQRGNAALLICFSMVPTGSSASPPFPSLHELSSSPRPINELANRLNRKQKWKMASLQSHNKRRPSSTGAKTH